MTAPERIWTVYWGTDGAVTNGAWADTVRHFGGGVEYILATPEALAASPEVQALVMAERERCAARVRADETEPLVAELARLRADYFSAKERLHNYDRAAIGGAE